ncbi:MAG TPA: hypothetical protein VII38_21545 [Polyangia bacterium]
MRSKFTLAALVALGLILFPSNARAVPVDFSAGSLIIPMDACYQPSAPLNCSQTTTCIAYNWRGRCTQYQTSNLCSPTTRVSSTYYTSGCPEPMTLTPAYDGILKAYGLVYRLLQKGIPVYYVVQTDPTLKSAIDATDLTVKTNSTTLSPVALLNHSTGAPVSFMRNGDQQIDYRGGPFVISATDAPAAIALLESDPLFTLTDPRTNRGVYQDVYIHVAQTNVLQASVRALLNQTPPRIALMDIGQAAVGNLEGYLQDAGLYYAAGGGSTTSLASYPTIGDVFTLFDNVTDFTTSDGLTAGNMSILWMPHWEGSALGSTTDVSAVLQKIKAFNGSGHAVFAQCASIATIEGADAHQIGSDSGNASGHFITNATGTSAGLDTNVLPQTPWPTRSTEGFTFNPDAAAALWSSPLIQIGDFPMAINAQSRTFDFVPDSGVSYLPGVSRLVASKAPSSEGSYRNRDIEVVYNNPAGTSGPLIYIGGHAFGTQGSSCSGSCSNFTQLNMLGPERLVLNSLVFLGQVPQNSELTRSAPIVYSDGKTYLGSYLQQTQPTAAYPPWQGHFREYPAGALSGANVALFNALSSDWDSANSIKNQAATDSRTLFTAVKSSGAWTQVSFITGNSATLGIAAATITSIRKGGLGGIDHSIPAIIGQSAMLGTTRPTVAYVGALDGMLHAILVSGTVSGKSPGDELWAFIPPSQLQKVVGQSAGVDGSPQVGDAFVDTGSGTRSWHTLLAIPDGSYGGGTLDVLDITDPTNPKFLWEASDSVTVNGKTFVLGRAQGAAMAPIMTSGGVGFAYFVATDNTNGSAGNAFNLYALDAASGAVLWRFNHIYANDALHNDVPGMVAALNAAGSGGPADTIYFGDLEGKVWAVPAATGGSSTLQPVYDAAAANSVPTSINYPIESGVVLYRDPSSQDLSLIGVTGGADWVPSSTLSQVFRYDTQTKVATTLDTLGTGERAYAAPTIYGNSVYILTSIGAIQSGIGASFNAGGNLIRIGLGAGNQVTTLATVKQGASEVAVDASGNVIAASAAGITQNGNAGVDKSQPVVALQNGTQKPITVRAWLDFH